MDGKIKKSNSPNKEYTYSHTNSVGVSKKEKNSDPKPNSKGGSSNKKGSTNDETCGCCSICCRGKDSDGEHRPSNGASKDTIPKSVVPSNSDSSKTESDHDRKIMTLKPVHSDPPKSPQVPIVKPVQSSASNPIKHCKTPDEFETFDPEPLIVTQDPEELEKKFSIEVAKKSLDIPDPEVEDDENFMTVVPRKNESDDSDLDDSTSAFHTEKLSVEGNDRKELELLERRKNSREGVGCSGVFYEDKPAEYLQLSRSKSSSHSGESKEKGEKEEGKDNGGSDLERPACFGCRLNVMSWLKKKP